MSSRFQVGIATAIFIGDWHTQVSSHICQIEKAAEIEKANLEQASMAMAGWHGTGSSKYSLFAARRAKVMRWAGSTSTTA